jgi:integrase
MRRGDCCLLKWADVNTKGPNPSITIKTSKTGETVCIPIYAHLLRELAVAQERWDGKSEYVWPEVATMQKANQQGVTWRLRQAFERAGFKDADIHAERHQGMRKASVKDFHSLRTTWITEALSRGVPIETVKLISGHRTVEVVTTHYFRLGQEQVRAALEGAMPRLLTNGEPDGHPAAKTAKAQVLEICKSMTAKTWKQDAARIATLVAEM